MARKYAIWNKTDPIVIPSGKVLTPGEWIAEHPVAGFDNVTVLCGAGDFNGSIFATLGHVMLKLEREGADFSKCTTDAERLDVIHAFLEEKEAKEAEEAENYRAREEMQADSLASIAASLEFQNMMSLPDVEV